MATVVSPHSEDDEFAAIWGSQTMNLQDEEEEEDEMLNIPPFNSLGGSHFGGHPGPAKFQQAPANFQQAPEELFWSDGPPPGASSAGPALPAFPQGNSSTEENELFWGGVDSSGEQAGHNAQWSSGGMSGGIFSGGIDLPQHTPDASWQYSNGLGGASNAQQPMPSYVSANWDMNSFQAPADSEDQPQLHTDVAGSSPTEYQPQHLMGEALSALLDE